MFIRCPEHTIKLLLGKSADGTVVNQTVKEIFQSHRDKQPQSNRSHFNSYECKIVYKTLKWADYGKNKTKQNNQTNKQWKNNNNKPQEKKKKRESFNGREDQDFGVLLFHLAKWSAPHHSHGVKALVQSAYELKSKKQWAMLMLLSFLQPWQWQMSRRPSLPY